MGAEADDEPGRPPHLLLVRLMAALSGLLAVALVVLAFLVPSSQVPVMLAGAVVGLVGVAGCVILAGSLRRDAAPAALRGSAVGVLMLLAAAVLLAPAVVWLVAGGAEAFTTLGLSTVALPAGAAVAVVLAGPALARDA